jgi:hypothetical protein
MEVHLSAPGCAHRAGTVLSFGLLPVLLRSQLKQYPASLTEHGMTLRNGTRIPWSSFTRYRATELYVRGVHVNTQHELWHGGGRVHFAERQLQDPEAVVEFIRKHISPEALRAETEQA